MGRPAEKKIAVELRYGRKLHDILYEMYVVKNLHSSDIAKELGVAPATIVCWCHEFGIEVKPKGGRIDYPEFQKIEMCRMYSNGYATKEIAQKYSCSTQTVIKALHDRNIHVNDCRERVVRKYAIDELYFQEINTDKKAYFLGFIAADGMVQAMPKVGYTMRIKIQKPDIEILQELRKEMKANYPINTEKTKYGQDCVTFRVHSATMVEDLIKHGIVPRKSWGMQPPATVPNKMIHHYIRGLFDGDGSVLFPFKDRNDIKVCFSGNITIMEWLRDLLTKECGVTKNKVCCRDNGFTTLSYTGANAIKIRDYMYPTKNEFGLKRKKEKLFKYQ